MSLDVDSLKQHIPHYLIARDEQSAFLRQLDKLFGGNVDGYFTAEKHHPCKDEVLQGDGWDGFHVFEFDSGKKRDIKGIVLSNSCDVSSENKRKVSPKIVFAPLIKLSAFESLLLKNGVDEDVVGDTISAIRAQRTTNIFFLPAGGLLDNDYFSWLDDLHSMPIEVFREAGTAKRLYTLSMAGFYLFAFKLSVHFCRMDENVARTI